MTEKISIPLVLTKSSVPFGTLLSIIDIGYAAIIQEHQNWLIPGNMDVTQEHLIQSVHTWVVKTKHHTILIDTASGNDKERPLNPIFHHLQLPYLDRLKSAGVIPEMVDYVLMTHLHVDHSGWNTRLIDDRWVPTFPKARYVFPKAEED